MLDRRYTGFAQGLFQSGDEEDELDASIGALLGLLALPGVFVSLSLFEKYSSLMRYFRGGAMEDHYLKSLPDKYFFIVFSMVVTGLITVWKWDRILPGKQDWINLAPLPLSARKILLANLAAIVGVATLFAVDVNLGSSILFPMIVTAEARSLGDVVAFIAVHALVVVAASVFTFFAVLFVLGVMMAVLPASAVARVALPVRLALAATFIALLGSSFAVPGLVRGLPPGSDSLWRYAPPVWFLGWYQALQSRATGLLAEVAPWGWRATLLVLAGAALAYGASYQRLFLSLPETQGMQASSGRERWPWLRRMLERWLWRTPFERAAGLFALRTLARSDTHLLIVTGFLAVGGVAAAQAAIDAASRPVFTLPGRAWLSIPLILVWFVVCGLRMVVDLPVAIQGNWAFRAILPPGPQPVMPMLRKLVLAACAVLVLLPTALAVGFVWGPAVAVGVVVFTATLAAILNEALLTGLRKVPFTCTRAPFQSHAPLLFAVFWVGFALFTLTGAAVERWMFDRPLRFLWLAGFAAAAAYAIREWRNDMPEVDHDIIWRDAGVKAMERLDLSAMG